LWDDVIELVVSSVMFDKANWPFSCANHTAGFSGQKCGKRITTRLILKYEPVGWSGRVDGSASCCMMRSQEEYRTNSRHHAVFYHVGVTRVVV
jgi:hypothetical protein